MKLTPFLIFDGNCAEAIRFYHSCLGGELTITTVGDTPMRDQLPPEQHAKVTHAYLKSGSVAFSATDWLHSTRVPRQGNTVAMYLDDGTYSELRAVFEALAEGGDPALCDDLHDMPFGSYGHLADKFGVHWFFHGPARCP